jgi:transmembrane sensor
MIDDAERHGPALARWIARNPARLELYNRVATNLNAATLSAARTSFPSRHKPWTRRSRTRPLGMVFAAIICAGLIFWCTKIWFPHSIDTARSVAAVAAADVAYDNPANLPRLVELPDQSSVILAPQSRIEVRFTPNERDIELARGRARFDVAHDSKRPFNVFAGGGRITAVGTLFDVEVGAVVKVHLLRGVIDVASPSSPGATSRARMMRLTAGGVTSFALSSPRTADASSNVTISAPLSSAPEPMALRTFDDMTLDTIVAQVNQASGTQIRIDDPEVGRQRAFVVLDVSDGRAAAQKLAALFHLDAREDEAGAIVLARRE